MADKVEKREGEVSTQDSSGDPAATHAHSMRIIDLALTVNMVLVTTAMVWFATADINASGLEFIFTRVVGVLGALVGGRGSFFFLARLWDRKPQLSLTTEGFLDRSPLGPVVSIRWEDILSLEATSGGGALELKLRDPRSVRIPTIRKWVTRLQGRGRDVDLLISLRGLDLSKEVLVTEVTTRHTEHLLNDIRAQKNSLESGDPDPREHQDLEGPTPTQE
jgi:hypothetical protein